MKSILRALAASFLICALSVATVTSSYADDTRLEVNGNAMKTNLANFVGKSVTIRLAGGEEIGGIVREVGDSSVHLSELSGKEFFDAVVKLDQIAAIIVRLKK